MASQIEELPPLILGKGCLMQMFIDHAKSKDDIDRHWTEVSYDGEADSLVLIVPEHWHKHHDEIMQVLSGRLKVTLDGKEHILTPESGPLLIPRLHVHGVTCIAGEKVTATEKTVPTGEFKALFFQDLFQTGTPSPLLAMRAFYYGDCYASLPGRFKFLDELFLNVLGFVAGFFAPPRLTTLKRKGEDASA